MLTVGQANERRRKRREAQEDLARLLKDRHAVMVVHYSCEDFYDRPDGASPRITSIAVRRFATGQTTSFSIHQMAERKTVSSQCIDEHYDELEREMLAEFNDYVKKNDDKWWVHWNMRDANYGFPAIAHRSRVLGIDPAEPNSDRLFDLARVVYAWFGATYASHPRLTHLIKMNMITALDMLTGKEEADAFEVREYVRLHLSTLRKVDVLASILERLEDGQLKTNATRREQYGSTCAVLAAFLQNHPVAVIGSGAIAITGFAFTILRFFT